MWNYGKAEWFNPGDRNPANWQAHYDTTGPEIIADQGSHHPFRGWSGHQRHPHGDWAPTARIQRRHSIVAVLPAEDLHGIEGLKHMATAIVPGIWDEGFPDRQMSVQTEDAYDMARRLALEEGMLVGQSAGAAVCAALELAQQIPEGVIVTIMPDAGDRYFSTHLWEA